MFLLKLCCHEESCNSSCHGFTKPSNVWSGSPIQSHLLLAVGEPNYPSSSIVA